MTSYEVAHYAHRVIMPADRSTCLLTLHSSPPKADRARRGTPELLYTRTANIKGGLTEGPAVAPDGSIYFTDMPFGSDAGMILRFDPQTRKVTVFTADSGKANGLTCDADGNLVACEGADVGRPPRLALGYQDRPEVRTVADQLSGQTIQLPQRPVHRQRTAASTSPIRATSAMSRANWSIAPFIGSTPTAR